jgi:PASTA domain
MKTSALVLIVALAGLDPLAASVAASQGTSDGPPSTWCDVPNVIGLSHDQAIQRLYSGDFSASVETRPSRTPRGIVIDQHPRQCRTSSDGRRVLVVVSTGPSETPTQDAPSAETPRRRSGGGPSVGTIATVGAITAIGIAILASRNKGKDKGADTDTGKDTPPAQAPSAPPVASAPPEPPRPPVRSAVVPDVRGMSAEEAERTIAAARLQARTTNPSEAAVAGAKVALQIPSAGTPVVPGASVAVTFEPPPPPPAPAVPTPPPAAVVTAPTPPVAPRIVRTPRPPIAAPTIEPALPSPEPVLPSSPIGGMIDGPRTIAPIVPAVEVEPAMPWVLALMLIVLAIALASIATHRSARPPAPRLTVIPHVDAGEQRIVAGGRSRSLDLSFSLDDGVQQIRCLESHVRIGALS